MGNTTVTIANAVAPFLLETLLWLFLPRLKVTTPDSLYYYRGELYSMWDAMCGRDWLEINAVNSTLFIFIIATAAKVFATLSGQIPSFHFQLLLPPFLCWTGNYAGARNLGLPKSSVGQAGGPTNTHSFTVFVSQTLVIQLWCLKVIELGLDEPAFVQSPNLFA